jgi:hypothetical protein
LCAGAYDELAVRLCGMVCAPFTNYAGPLVNPNHRLHPMSYLTTPRLLFVANMCPVMFTSAATLTALANPGKPGVVPPPVRPMAALQLLVAYCAGCVWFTHICGSE